MAQEGRFDEFRDKIATVDASGKRIWVFPKKQFGKYFNLRQIIAYSLLIVLFTGPFIKIGGEPLLMANIIERKFVIFGQIFWPQDMFIFALAMVAMVVLVIVFTVVFGRLFCGWVCPQTVFMELVFRRIEYWIDGDWTDQKKLDRMPWNWHKIYKRAFKWSIFWLISFLIANTFLAYIVGIEELEAIVLDNPSNHVGGLIALLVFTTVFFAVFTWFREQVCTTVCPYGRLQGVLLDKNSIVVAYDYKRGENRAPLHKNEDRKAAEKGDCIDCHLCVNVCPTGIDIRNGTQLECTNCTLCMDACDHMMDRVGLDKGLIRYDSEEGIKTGKKWHLNGRAKAYIVLMLGIVGLLVSLLLTRSEIELNIIGFKGTVYTKLNDSTVVNFYNANLFNKTNLDQDVELKVLNEKAELEVIGEPIHLKGGETEEREIVIRMLIKNLNGPKTPIKVGLYRKNELIESTKINFSGPGF